ncbi:MAG TPA: hypothetical protein VGM90_19785 [Kofleriaceae bacterium]|jgi:hypothetical protein
MLRLFSATVVVTALASVAHANLQPLDSPYDEHLDTPRYTLGATAFGVIGSAGTDGDTGFDGFALAGSYRLRPSIYVIAQLIPYGDALADGGSGLDSSTVWGGRIGLGWEHWGDFASVGIQLSTGFTHVHAVRYDGLISDDAIIDDADSIPLELRIPLRLRIGEYAALEVAPMILDGVAVRGGAALGGGLSLGIYATLP